MCRATASLAVALLLAAAPAGAQEKLVDVNIGGGYTFAASEVRDHLGDGYNFNIGIIFNVNETVGIQTEYSFNGLGDKRISLPVHVTPAEGSSGVPTDFFADMNMQFVDFNVIVRPRMDAPARPYLIAGLGWYYRPVKVTTPGVGYVPGYCDPWWYVCYPGGFVPVENIVGERSSSDFGMDFGGGVTIGLGETASFYVEARYHYIWGPEVTNPVDQESTKANGQFFPITFGLRF
jgi:opacity protein-like surface antigen